jgi:transposase
MGRYCFPGTKTSLSKRYLYQPTEVKTMQAADIIEGWKSYVKRHAGLRKAQLLIDLAKRSVGPKQALQAYKLHLQQLLEEYDLAQTQLQQVELEIKSVLNRIPYAKKQLAIKGMSTISIAGILGESGDLSGFAHGNSLLATQDSISQRPVLANGKDRLHSANEGVRVSDDSYSSQR